MVNPALQRFVQQLSHPFTVGQILVRRHPRGFDLRHVDDGATAEAELKTMMVPDLRALAQFTESGQFRPLRSASDLRTGWICVATNEAELEHALDQLYPGFLPDWFSTLDGMPPVTHFRPFMARQSGRHRAVKSLPDAEAAQVIRACCAGRFCLKRRLWTVKGLAADAAGEKSTIPCLEPCAILLEFARHAVGLEGDVAKFSETNLASLERQLDESAEGVRVADFADARNPRCLQLQIERGK